MIPTGSYYQSPSQLANRVRIHSTIASVAAQLFPKFGYIFANVIAIIELFGASVLYMILLGQSASALFGPLMTYGWPVTYWTVIMTGACVPLLLYPQMRVVAWFSVIALIGLFGSITLVLVYCAMSLPGMKHIWTNFPTSTLSQLPVSLSIIVFSYCAHAILPGIEGTMKKPEQYNRMMNISFGVAAVTKAVFGILAAMVFGPTVAQAVTESMVNHPALVISVHVSVLLNVFFSLPLILHVMGEQLDCAAKFYLDQSFFVQTRFCSLHTLWFMSSRCSIITLGLMLGTMVPHFALVMGLVGAITGSLLCFIFPALFHLLLFWTHLSGFSKAIRVCICIFGVLMGAFGVAFSGRSIYMAFLPGQ